jgi:hypothetical protein
MVHQGLVRIRHTGVLASFMSLSFLKVVSVDIIMVVISKDTALKAREADADEETELVEFYQH